MTESQEQTLAEARNYVTDLFTNKVDPQLVFHSLVHTEDVAEACSQMSEINKLSDDDHFILLMSAWFHDTGYSTGQAEGHEEVSIQLCKDFLQKHNVDDTFIQKISSCIAATKMPQSPVSQVEKILCDADLMHLSTEDFKARNELLKQEREYLIGKKIDKKEWRKNNISFLQHHKYFTEYGQQTLEPGKLINNNLLKKKKKSKQEIVPEHAKEAFPYVFSDKPVLDLKTVQKNAERGIQTMFRTTSSNHFELSSLADSKANIMISVNSIIISVALTVLLARLAFYPEYTVPTLILLVVCLAAIIFAILATRPSVNKGTRGQRRRKGEASHGPYWHRRAQEGQPDLPPRRGG